MLKKKKTALIALVTGGVILAGAAAANFATSNGYNIYKESARRLFDQTSYTMNLKLSASIDGEELVSEEVTEQYDKESRSYAFKNISRDNTDDKYPERCHERYYQDGIYIYYSSPAWTDNNEYVKSNTYHVQDLYSHIVPQSSFDKSNFVNDEELFDKYFNFGMTCVDMLVGDIKNNFVLMNAQDGLSTYEATLDLFQIPEIVNSGADLLASQLQSEMDHGNQDEIGNEIAKLIFEPFVNSVKCTFTVDDEGRLVDTVISGELLGKDESGESHTLDAAMQLSFSDYGTTVPERIDLEGDNIQLESDEQRTRLAELEVLLAGKLSNEDRDSYENEYKYTKARLDYFDKYGPINSQYVDFVENDDGEVEVRIHEVDKNGIYQQTYSAPTSTKEEIVEEITSEEVINLDPDSADGASSVGIIGGTDGPTEVYVAK